MKSRKPLWKISVSTTSEAEDAIVELLGRLFNSTASAYFDLKKKTCVVSVYSSEKFIERDARRIILQELKNIQSFGLNIHPGRVSISKIRREDWAESWKRHFKPVEIGKSLLIKPSWSRKRARKGQAEVILDPGLSFGTGQHPTTLFCLREIARSKASHGETPSFLDIGTGSGILAIAAAKLGFSPVRAFDFDPDAVRIARDNAQKNRVLKYIQLGAGNVCRLKVNSRRRFDFICANLISTLLIEERKKIVAQLKPGGCLVLAGILHSEFAGVQRAYEQCGLKLVSARTEKEWRSGSFSFKHFLNG